MSCVVCGSKDALKCRYCGQNYCPQHAYHNCLGAVNGQQTNHAYSYDPMGQRREKLFRFSRKEVADIVVAWLALSAAFYIAKIIPRGVPLYVSVSGALLIVGSGFVLHELGHKFAAQRMGYFAEFRIWPQGILLCLITSVFGIIFAAPGATYVSTRTVKEYGEVSLAGPAVNIFLAMVFFLAAQLPGVAQAILATGLAINVWLATFNLIPLGPLDGAKIFKWKKELWAVLFVPLALVTAVVFFGL